MQTLNVALGERAYPIHIGRGLLDRADLILPHLKTRRVALVTNEVVGPLYLERLRSGLDGGGVVFWVHAGDSTKRPPQPAAAQGPAADSVMKPMRVSPACCTQPMTSATRP